MSFVRSLQSDDVLTFSLPVAAAVMATGVDLKNSLCLAADGDAHLSKVNGDINDPVIFQQVGEALRQVGNIDAVACDLHPDLLSTRLACQLAERFDVPLIPVQHHHAHIAAVMAEHGVEGGVVGLAMDGYGFGTDGSAWGGECLYVNDADSVRVGCLKPVPMPGGDAASRQPWRMAVAWLNDHAALPQLFGDLPLADVQKLCGSERTPVTSSAGRLFDAASAIVLGSREVSFEGEAAIALEKAATGVDVCRELPYRLDELDGTLQLDCSEALTRLVEAILAGESKPELAAAFHQMLAKGMAEMALCVAKTKGVKSVVLAGGCFLNKLLKVQIAKLLEGAGLHVFCSEQVPQGDGAIALGQAWVALHKINGGSN